MSAEQASWREDERAVFESIQRMREDALDLAVQRARRLLRVAERLRRGAVSACGERVAPVLGVVAAAPPEVMRSLHEVADRRFGFAMEDEVRVFWVEPGYAAAAAGVVAGDLITSVDGETLTRGSDLARARPEPGRTEMVFGLMRDGEEMSVDVPIELGCRAWPRLVQQDVARALIDRNGNAFVTTGMLREFPSDDELALVLSHEMAHDLLRHRRSSPEREAAADYLGTYLAAIAGFDLAGAVGMWKRLTLSSPANMDSRIDSHPTTPSRLVALEETIREIEAKRQAGQPLLPGRTR